MLISDEDMRALARLEGVREVALGDCIMHYRDDEPFVTYLKRTKANIGDPDTGKPHWFSAPAVDTPDEAVLYNVDAQVRYANAHSVAELTSLLAANGLTPGRVLPKPTKDNSGRKAAKDNPWSAEGWNLTTQSHVWKTLGETKAQEIAAAAGCVLGSTKPNPAYN
jgi:hypothetical protein